MRCTRYQRYFCLPGKFMRAKAAANPSRSAIYRASTSSARRAARQGLPRARRAVLMADGLIVDARDLAPAFSDSDMHVLVSCLCWRGVQSPGALVNAPAGAMRALMRGASQVEVELLVRAAQSASTREW